MWPTWPPTNGVRVGDFGRLEQGFFQRQGRLDDDPALTARADQPRADQLFASAGVRHSVLAAAGGLPEGEIGAKIEFGSKFGVFLALRECRDRRLADPLAAAAKLAKLREEDRWRDDYCLVTSVVAARSALIAVGSEAGGTLELSAAAPAADILACLGGDLSISGENSVGYRAVVGSGCTPLFTLSRLGKRKELQLRGEPRTLSPRLLELDPSVE